LQRRRAVPQRTISGERPLPIRFGPEPLMPSEEQPTLVARLNQVTTNAADGFRKTQRSAVSSWT
jgi:hypothetical protein